MCSNGACTCRPGLQACAGQCVDTKSNPNHCGGCGAPCGGGQKCQGGVCSNGTTCTQPLVACAFGGGRVACVDTEKDNLNCGGCANVCAREEICVLGQCLKYRPSSPCSTCPCTTVCQDQVGKPNVCCPGLGGSPQPICVEESTCP
jgi:hypothetical protein